MTLSSSMLVRKIVLLVALIGVTGGGLIAAEASLPPVPAHRPRLYLRPDEVPGIASRLRDPALAAVVERLQRLATKHEFHRIEWEVVRYMAEPNEAQGRQIIADTILLLKQSDLPGKPDATRFTGRIMVTGAIVYDWLYALLTAEDKKVLVAELIRLAQTQECGYPPKPSSVITGHGSEAMIIRDMLSAGIAIHDEYPEMYALAAAQVLHRMVPARNWFYPGHAHHQGDSYAPYRFQWEMFATYIFDRIGVKNLFVRDQAQIPYQWIYSTRPDGQRLRSGDTFRDSVAPGRPWNEYAGGLLAASYYGDPVLMGQFMRHGGTFDDEVIFDFLWRDTALPAAPLPADLPQSRYFGFPFGWMIARTGWDENAVVAEMKVNEYNFVNHQHMDAGAFQIYYRGALALDAGLYQRTSEGAYGRAHTRNYAWRTIAHNTLLVYDPQENFGREGWVNDGGQRLPNLRAEPRDLEAMLDPSNGYRTGRVVAHGFGPDATRPSYTLLQGDITAAYSAKVKQVNRSFAFLRFADEQAPAAMVVYDRVVSTDPTFKKIWLLHSMEEPQIEGPRATVRAAGAASGVLDIEVLAPASGDVMLGKVGGPGREFWVFGENFPNNPPPEVLAKSTIESGNWRLELSPGTARTEDEFLVVLQPKQAGATVTDARRVASGDRVGAWLERGGEGWLVLFQQRSERTRAAVEFTVPKSGANVQVLIADLASGPWRAVPLAGGEPVVLVVAEASGAACFSASAGAWRLEPQF